MPEQTAPNLGMKYGYDPGESGWDAGMDANLKKIDALLSLALIDRDLATPPGSPANGDRYLVAAGGTGDWSGQDGDIAVRVAGAWEFYTPTAGQLAYVLDEALLLAFNGSAWVAV